MLAQRKDQMLVLINIEFVSFEVQQTIVLRATKPENNPDRGEAMPSHSLSLYPAIKQTSGLCSLLNSNSTACDQPSKIIFHDVRSTLKTLSIILY